MVSIFAQIRSMTLSAIGCNLDSMLERIPGNVLGGIVVNVLGSIVWSIMKA
jgi:hypothetical protein